MLSDFTRETTTANIGLLDCTGLTAVNKRHRISEKHPLNHRVSYVIEDDAAGLQEEGIGYLSAIGTLVRELVTGNSSNTTALIDFNNTNTKNVIITALSHTNAPIAHRIQSAYGTRRVFSAHVSEDSTNLAMVPLRIYYSPFLYTGHPDSFDGLFLRVVTEAAAAGIKIGWFEAKADFTVGNKVTETIIDIDASTQGTKLETCPVTPVRPGWGFIAYISDSNPTIREAAQQVLCPLGVDGSNNPYRCYTENSATFSLPATATPGGVTASYGAPHVGIEL